MLLSHRETSMPSLGARLDTHAVVHSDFRVHLVKRSNVVSEDAMLMRAFRRVGHVTRPTLTVILEGRGRIRACGTERWLEAGDVSLIEAKTGVEMRQEGESFTSLVIEWQLGALGTSHPSGFATGRLDARAMRRIHDSTHAFADHALQPVDAAQRIADVLAVLRAAGMPFDPIARGDLIEDVPDRIVRLGRALDEVLSHLEGTPMSVDLEARLGLGARQVNRLVAEYNARFGFNACGWRDTRNRRQVLLGATLMTAPGAVAERIASAVGYGSARAFNRALANAGLPSASNIASTVSSLV